MRTTAHALVVTLVAALVSTLAGPAAATGSAPSTNPRPVPPAYWSADPSSVPIADSYVVFQRDTDGYHRGDRTVVVVPEPQDAFTVSASATPSGRVRVRVPHDLGVWTATFAGPTSNPRLAPGLYAELAHDLDTDLGAFELTTRAPDSSGSTQAPWDNCAAGDRSFVVDDVAHDPTGRLLRLRLRFSVDCGPGVPDLHGEVVHSVEGWDAWPPDTWMPVAPSSASATSTAAFRLAATKSSVTYECRLDAAAWGPCQEAVRLTGLVDGGHRFEARATDAHGNVDATPAVHTWRVDTRPPLLTFSARPPVLDRVLDVTFRWAWSEPVVVTRCRLDGGQWEECGSPLRLQLLEPGSHRLEVRAADPAGNVTTAAHAWRIDTVAPTVRFTSTPARRTTDTTAVIAFAADEAATFECRREGGTWARCSSPHRLSALPEGHNALEVRATDAAGNLNGTPARLEWVVTPATSAPVAPPVVPAVTFVDDDQSIFEDAIEALAAAGIAKGCDPPTNTRFCPDDRVTRGQMAAFLQRGLGLRTASGDPFRDDDGSTFEPAIEALAAAGVTRGCNPPRNDRYCPDGFVTRGEMAAFLQRALDLPTPRADRFRDDDTSAFEPAIEALAAADVTKGCNPPRNDRFCPDAHVTRGQMAAFLQRALGL